MSTFKEISVEDYKKFLDNRQHTFVYAFECAASACSL